MLLKKLRPRYAELCLCVIVLAALLLRLILIHLNWPLTDSDEGTMDLMALHIAFKGEHPIFFYGQGYMGTLQAYLGALLFHFFGVSIFTVRLGLLPLFALYLIFMYALTRLLYTKNFALAIAALLSLGSSAVIRIQVFANGGYGETMFFGALIFFLVVYLALTAQTTAQEQSVAWRIRRLVLYGLLGLAIGVAFWSDFLILPCLMAALLFLGICCWREIRAWTGVSLLLCLFIGIIPIILYNLAPLPGSDSLRSILGITGYTRSLGISFLQKLGQVLLMSTPLATGAYPLCKIPEPVSPVSSIAGLFPQGQVLPCALIHGSWTLGLLLLWGIALVVAALAIWRQRSALKNGSFDERQKIVRQGAQLMLLVSAAMTFLLFTFSVRAAGAPQSSARYLVCMLFATPVVLWPLWHGSGPFKQRITQTTRRIHMRLIIRVALLLFVALVFVEGTFGIAQEIPGAQAAYQQQETFAQQLLQLGATRIYSDYWTCARMTFQTQEKIICSTLDDQLNAGFDRYQPYHDIVHTAPYPAYVFLLNSPQAQALTQASHKLDARYRRYVLSGYIVYAIGPA